MFNGSALTNTRELEKQGNVGGVPFLAPAVGAVLITSSSTKAWTATAQGTTVTTLTDIILFFT